MTSAESQECRGWAGNGKRLHTVTLAEGLVGAVGVGLGTSMRDDVRAAGMDVAKHDADEPLRPG